MEALSPLISEAINYFFEKLFFSFCRFLYWPPTFMLEAYFRCQESLGVILWQKAWIDGDLKTLNFIAWWSKWAPFEKTLMSGRCFLLCEVHEGNTQSAWGLKVWPPVFCLFVFGVRNWISHFPTFGRVCRSLITSGDS